MHEFFSALCNPRVPLIGIPGVLVLRQTHGPFSRPLILISELLSGMPYQKTPVKPFPSTGETTVHSMNHKGDLGS